MDMLEAIDGRLALHPPPINTSRSKTRYLVPTSTSLHGNAAIAYAKSPLPLFKILNLLSHISTCTIGTSIMHSPAALGCGAHPNQTTLTSMQMLSSGGLLDNQHISSTIGTFRCLIDRRVRREHTSQRQTSHTNNPFSSHVFGRPSAPGSGDTPRRATSSRYSHKLEQGLLKTGPRVGGRGISGMLVVGSWRKKQALKQLGQSGRNCLSTADPPHHSIHPRHSTFDSKICRACITSLFLSVLILSVIVQHASRSVSHKQVAGPSKHVVGER